MNEQQGAVNDLGRRFARRLPGPMQSGLRQLVRRIARTGSSNPLGTGPVLTVIVVAHNAASYLIQCMRSLQSQTLKAIEVIIVDSGSTDGTAAVADEMAAEDFRFRVLLRPPLSVTAARNAGVRVARGRFVAFVDATDHRAAYRLCNLDQFAPPYRFGLRRWQRTHGHPRSQASTHVGRANSRPRQTRFDDR
jgi:hypothetical protein